MTLSKQIEQGFKELREQLATLIQALGGQVPGSTTSARKPGSRFLATPSRSPGATATPAPLLRPALVSPVAAKPAKVKKETAGQKYLRLKKEDPRAAKAFAKEPGNGWLIYHSLPDFHAVSEFYRDHANDIMTGGSR